MTELSRSLPLSDAMLAGMVAISADAIIAVDSAQRIVFFNAGAEQVFGYSAAEAIDRPLSDLLPARFRESHRVQVERFGVSSEPARRMGERQKISGLRRNGEEFPAEASIARVAVHDRVAYTVVLRDVTERQRIEHELRGALESRDQMAGIVSHDLRNPVQAVKMLSRAILQRANDGEVTRDIAEQVAVIHQAAEQMDALIKDLADVTRIEAGQLRVRPVRSDTITLVELAAATLAPLAQAKDQQLRIHVDDSLPPVMADGDRVLQLFSNVIGNAIKFTPNGGTIDVHADVREDPSRADGLRYVEFTVTDSGPGIPSTHLPQVFNRYWQSAHVVRPGSGLGLAIAKGIVEAHLGWIEVQSVEGASTTVRFGLPCAQ
jgi:PAS domain S-box-containing protein